MLSRLGDDDDEFHILFVSSATQSKSNLTTTTTHHHARYGTSYVLRILMRHTEHSILYMRGNGKDEIMGTYRDTTENDKR